MIHWCIFIPLASCSSHPSIFVQSVCHSVKSWHHRLTVINLAFTINLRKMIGTSGTLPWMKYFWLCVICNSYMHRHLNLLNLSSGHLLFINTISLPFLYVVISSIFIFVTWPGHGSKVSWFLFLDLLPVASPTKLFTSNHLPTAHLSVRKWSLR